VKVHAPIACALNLLSVWTTFLCFCHYFCNSASTSRLVEAVALEHGEAERGPSGLGKTVF